VPEHLRALVVIIGLAVPVFWIAQRVLCPDVIATADFVRRRNVWFALTLAAFLSHNKWVFLVISATVLWWAGRPARERNPLALFFFVMFAVPGFSINLSGLGIVQSLFEVTHIRLMMLLVLLPAALRIRRTSGVVRLGGHWADRCLIGYLLLTAAQYFTAAPLTQAMRETFYLVGDSLIIFYVASRLVSSLPSLRDVVASYCVAMLVIVPIAVFEFGRSWLLYAALDGALGLGWDGIQYLGREGLLRATGPAGHSLVLGYALAVGLGLWLGLQHALRPFAWWAGLFALSIGLIAPVSRGPWVGAVLIVLLMAVTGQRAGSRTFKLLLAAGFVLVAVAMSPYADKMLSFVPFIGDVDQSNVSYRQRILDVTWMVILENPLFGTPHSLSNPLMEQLRQGQGIIDLVNSYIVVALFSGLVGLFMFVGVFAFSVLPLFTAIRRAGKLSPEIEAFGRSVLATVLGVMFMIATVSSILSVPIIYWSLCALALAYARLTKQASATQVTARPTAQVPAPGHRQPLDHVRAKREPTQ
jgi:hypothetical protein